ncbi:MAG: helix-turn-helix transcriptional regulator, partial [Proteobacteria bacterium]|nr:helix-turn-helix transcriptional regulator [Pseudomonadota bacterium]
MNSATAVAKLSALAHGTRLDVVRELAKSPEGLQASVLADRLKLQRSALSNHLKTLST